MNLKSIFLFLFLAVFNIFAEERKLNILVVVGNFPVVSEVCIFNQIIGLIDRGHNVELFASGRSIDTVVHHAVVKYDLLNNITYKTITKSALKKFDIILCQFGTLGKQFAQFKEKYDLKAKLVTCFRGYDTSNVLRRKKNVYAHLFEIGDLFLPVCECFKQKLISVGAPTEKTIVQHSAIDCSLFQFKDRTIPRQGTIQIMTASRLVPKKGHVYMLRALVHIVKQYRSVQYTIIGSGKLKVRLQQLVQQLGLGSHVRFLDAVPHQDLVKILDTADLFVLPSVVDAQGDAEGIPNALKEAMVMGIPVISTYHSGIPELIRHNHSGLLVPEKDAQALGQAVMYAIENPKLCKRMAKNARDTVLQEYELESQNDRLEQLLLKLHNEGI